MATRWERLAGDTSRFAIRLSFIDDPDGGDAADADRYSSWGGFQIWVHNTNLCAHREEGERVEFAYWYLLPMLEWFVACWDPLLHEERLPCRSRDATGWHALRYAPLAPFEMDEEEEDRRYAEWHAWWSRHALTACREGGIFPDVVFRRLRDSIEVSWGKGDLHETPDHVSFDVAQPGAATLRPAEVANPLYEIIEGASKYLADTVQSARLKELLRTVRALPRPRAQEQLMWLAGLGAEEKTMRREWDRVRKYISSSLPLEESAKLFERQGTSRLVVEGSCHAALMFGTLAPTVYRDDIVALCDMAVGLSSARSEQGLWRTLARSEPVVADHAPWWQGYHLADSLHEDLDGHFLTGEHVDVEALLGRLAVGLSEIELTDTSIRGVAMVGPDHRPGIAWNRLSPMNWTPPGRRFTLAHELCHILFDHGAGRRLSMASGPWAPVGVEQRANAFAAMLLMPASLVQRAAAMLDKPIASEQGVAFVARGMQTGFEATLRHLGNLGVIDDVDRQRIQAEREAAAEQ